MESANHEFTWLSGRPQVSTSFVRHEPPQSTLKPTPLPRHHKDADTNLGSKPSPTNNNGTSTGSKRPVPLPRIFQRPLLSSSLSDTSIIATPHYDVPTPHYDLPPPLPETLTSSFYGTPSQSYHSSISKSVIFEFDPIMQSSDKFESGCSQDDGDPNLELKSPERDDSDRKHDRLCSSSTSGGEVESNEIEPKTVPLALTNGQPTPPTAVSLPRTPPTRPAMSSSPQIRKKQTVIEHSPQLPPKSPLTKTPKFGLSTVPPPPNQAAQARPTSSTVKVPIHVDNPCYMFVTATGALQNCIDDSSGESDNESVSSSEGLDPPKFPPPLPPPPPPTPHALVPASAIVDEDFFTPPLASIIVDVNKCPPAPRAVRAIDNGDEPSNEHKPVMGSAQLYRLASSSSLDDETVINDCYDSSRSRLDSNEDTTDKKSKPKYPIYQNLLEISGSKEGVYARIRKAVNAASASSPFLPPPLPPRGQNKSTTATLSETSVDADSRNRTQTLSCANEQLSEVLRNLPHRGVLYKIGRGRKDISQKWVLLERGHLQQFANEKSENPQEIFHHTDMISIARGPDTKHNNQELNCFEVVTSTLCKDRPHVFGAKYVSERDSWMQHIFQSIAPSVAITDTRGVIKAGYVKARKSISGVWQTFWLVLVERNLCLWPTNDASCLKLDLRKVISMQEYETDPQVSMMTIVDGPLFVIHYPALTVYVLSKIAFDTADWFLRIRQTSLEHGSSLEEQQLTHEDVPVIVDKCTKFVSTYGISTKGIYRESGTSSKITKLLDNLRKDAWKVHIQPDEYSEHDVANALKRFLRTLPNALLMRSLYSQWIAAAGAPKVEALSHYGRLLGQLPKINYLTIKKLVAHLRSVCEQDKVNLMDVSNIAAVFGPSLMSTEGDMNLANSSAEMDVISSLISNYPTLFGVSAEEIEKEEKIQKALQELREARRAQKPAGDILVGIYVHNREWGKCLNVKLSPSMTALDLSIYALHQLRMRDRVEQLAVFEVVCNGEMERPLHYSEIVLVVTLRWASWSDTDARDSYLLIKKCDLYQHVLPLMRQPLTMFGELRFADVKSKSFKKFMFEFKNASLAYYKDAKISQPLGSWNIEDITWYIGCDCRRQPHTEWSITFIEQKATMKRGTKETPYFGRTICFSSEEELYRWIAAMLAGQYPNGILPKLEPIDLLS